MADRDLYGDCASFYDDDYACLARTDDVRYYVDLAVRSGGPVLEMGCGTGRVLRPIARAGVQIDGVDISPGMLECLRSNLAGEPEEVRDRVRVRVGDMASVAMGSDYPLIISPFRAVQHLLTRERQRAWLRNVTRQLGPGGRLAFDVFQPDFSFLIGPAGPTTEVDRVDLETGRRTRRSVETVPHPELQTMDLTFRWQVENTRGRKMEERQTKFSIRWFTRGELINLLELGGFEVVHYWGSFDREPFGEGSKEQIIEARHIAG